MKVMNNKDERIMPLRSIVFAIISICISIIMVLNISYKLKSDSEKHIVEANKQIAEKVDDKFRSHIDQLKKLEKSIEVGDGKGTFKESAKNIHMFSNGTTFESFHIIGLDGKTICEGKENVDLSDRRYIERALKGETVISRPVTSRIKTDGTKGKKVIVYATPIKDNNDKIIGVLEATVDVKRLQNELKTNFYDYPSNMYVLNERNELITSSIKDEKTKLDANVLAKVNSNEEVSEKTIDNHENYLIYTNMQEKGWHIITTIPKSAVKYNSGYIISFTILILLALNVLFILYDIKAQKAKRELEEIAYTDKLTGGNNFDRYIIEAEEIVDKNENVAVVNFDLKNFSSINSVFGYEVGNKLIKTIAEKLEDKLPGEFTLTRTNGDLFSITIVLDETNTIGEVVNVINNVINISAIEELNSNDLHVEPAIGVYFVKDKSLSIADMVEYANVARFKHHEFSENKYCVFEDEYLETRERELKIKSSIKEAVENGEFVVYYQPKVDPMTDKIVGMEALVRWNSTEFGFVSPGQFIPVAEDSGDIALIGRFVLEQVCKDLTDWKQKGYELVTVSVNISKVELYQHGLIDDMMKLINKYDVDPDLIEMELTESVVGYDEDYVTNKINLVKRVGFGISLDDFGTGTSSFRSLKVVDIDVIKIDRMFLIDIETNPKSRAMVQSMINLSKELGCQVVCEGVEHKEQVKMLREMGCDMIQGFVYFKPLPKDEVEKHFTKVSE